MGVAFVECGKKKGNRKESKKEEKTRKCSSEEAAPSPRAIDFYYFGWSPRAINPAPLESRHRVPQSLCRAHSPTSNDVREPLRAGAVKRRRGQVWFWPRERLRVPRKIALARFEARLGISARNQNGYQLDRVASTASLSLHLLYVSLIEANPSSRWTFRRPVPTPAHICNELSFIPTEFVGER